MSSLAVQLLTYDRTDLVALRALFVSLEAQMDKSWTLHWWDNGSSDENYAAFSRAIDDARPSFPVIRRRNTENIGFAGGHQALYAAHDADYVALLNDDAILEPAYLAELRKTLDARLGLGAATGAILRWDYGADGEIVKTDIVDSLGLARARTHKVYDIGANGKFDPAAEPEGGVIPVFGVSGCLPMYRRGAVGAVLFDPEYFVYKEDVDLAYRLNASGWSAATVFAARAYHHRTLRPSLLHRGIGRVQEFHSYRNHLVNLKKHLTREDWLRDGVFIVAFETAKAVFMLMSDPSILWQAWTDGFLARTERPLRIMTALAREGGRVPPEIYDVAIVTVCTDRLDESCLRSVDSLRKATPLKSCFIVVDNGSTKFDAHAYVKAAVPDAIVLLRDANYGFGNSCNRGAAEVEANYYFFLNPDTRIDDDAALAKLHAFMAQDPGVGIAAPRLRYMDGRIQETCRRFPKWYTPIHQRLPFLSAEGALRHRSWFLMQDFAHDAVMPIDWAQGSALMVDGGLFRELGGFDERFWMYYEDVDICRRVWERGRSVYYLPQVELFHAYGKESAKMKNVLHGLIANQKTRTHIMSWIKYTIKWFGKRI